MKQCIFFSLIGGGIYGNVYTIGCFYMKEKDYGLRQKEEIPLYKKVLYLALA